MRLPRSSLSLWSRCRCRPSEAVLVRSPSFRRSTRDHSRHPQPLRMVADQMAATAEKARLIEELKRANGALSSQFRLERRTWRFSRHGASRTSFSNMSHELRTAYRGDGLHLPEGGTRGPDADERRNAGRVRRRVNGCWGSSAVCPTLSLKRGAPRWSSAGSPQGAAPTGDRQHPGRPEGVELPRDRAAAEHSAEGDHARRRA